MNRLNNNQSYRLNSLKPLLAKKASVSSAQRKAIHDIPKKKMDQVEFSQKALKFAKKEPSLSSYMSVDKGTAAKTTVQVSQSAFDKIMNATTYGEPKWEEWGNDGSKKWVVVNGQRFEVPLSAAEKEKMKNKQKTLLDYIIESDNRIKEENKDQLKEVDKISGNIEALKNNEEVMLLLGKIFA